MAGALALLAAAAGAAAPATAAATSATFKLTVYGVQHYVYESWHDVVGEPSCLSIRGTYTEGSTLRFTSVRPVRVRVTARRGRLSFQRLSRADTLFLLPGKGTYEASGVDVQQAYDCQTSSWVDDDPPERPDCPATQIDGLGIDVFSPGRGRVAVRGGLELPPLGPLSECTRGDLSWELYEATSRVDAGELLSGDAREAELVLRARQVERDESPGGTTKDGYERVRKATVYVNLTRLG
ncbi:MAG TPA: hypothetical protein VFR97_15575 [Capillimicrobium sp.]|nr:hypothetical protein [Capillimicrobium sp.]